MSQDDIDIAHLAQLARIKLTDDELGRFKEQLGDILGHIDTLSELDVDGIEPTAHAVTIHNVYHQDETSPGLDQESVLENAPAVTFRSGRSNRREPLDVGS